MVLRHWKEKMIVTVKLKMTWWIFYRLVQPITCLLSRKEAWLVETCTLLEENWNCLGSKWWNCESPASLFYTGVSDHLWLGVKERWVSTSMENGGNLASIGMLIMMFSIFLSFKMLSIPFCLFYINKDHSFFFLNQSKHCSLIGYWHQLL